jgi:FMN-dependent NADH-azoreductase
MYNFSIPSQLKAWIDRISIAGKTFRYTEKGPQGLAHGKQVVLAVSRGGVYGADSRADFGESYLKYLLGFLGIDDVTVVRAEGLSHPANQREVVLRDALATLPVPTAHAAAPAAARLAA